MSKEQISKSVGELTANLLLGSLKDRPDLEEVLGGSEGIIELRMGNLKTSTIKAVVATMREIDPSYQLVNAIGEQLTGPVAREAKEYAKKGDWNGLLQKLTEGVEGGAKNPYCAPMKDVAKSLVGAPIIFIYSPGSIQAGVITMASAYRPGDTKGFDLYTKEPGVIGYWQGRGRGDGYRVACISAHPPGQEGFVAIHGVTLNHERLKMDQISEIFGFSDKRFVGTSILHPQSQIKIVPGDPNVKDLISDVRTVSEDSSKKGENCIATYNLKIKR